MLLAQIHHKLSRPEEESEDLLTSNVFGALMYSGRSGLDVLFRFLSGAVLGNGSRIAFDEVVACTYRFWPWLPIDEHAGSEPDVVLECEHHGNVRTLVAIEAKYKSGKSSLPGAGSNVTDQLGREWLGLRRRAQDHGIGQFVLIYLTADIGMPRSDIDASIDEIQGKLGLQPSIAWLSWRGLPRLLDRHTDPILIDLARLLRRAMLVHFDGIEMPTGAPPPSYMFDIVSREAEVSTGAPILQHFAWPTPGRMFFYEFERRAMFHWPLSHKAHSLKWKFAT